MGNKCHRFYTVFSKNSSKSLPSLVSQKPYSFTLANEEINPTVQPIQSGSSNKLLQYRKSSIIEDYIVIWLSSNINKDQKSIKQVQTMFNSFRLFNDIDEFFDFIIPIKDQNLFLIVSDVFAQKLVPFIHETSNFIAIYIMSSENLQDTQWIKQYRKIKGIFTHIQPVCERLKRKIYLSLDDIIPIEIVSSSSIIIQYLLKQILLEEINYNEKSKQDFIDFARKQYPNELEIINEFEEDYTPSTAIRWYTRKNFLYIAINEAFRTQNLSILIKMGFIIQDIYKQINELYIENDQQDPIIVYRGQGILENELEILKNNQNGLLSFNNFLWTNTNRKISLSFAHAARNNPDLCGILFRIKINSLIKYISLDNLSYYLNSESEIFFSIYSLFRINKIKQIEEKVWEINLILIDNNNPILKDNLQSIEDIQGQTAWEKLGFYLIQIKQNDKAEDLYKTLLETKSFKNSKQLALLNKQLGFIYFKKKNSSNSLLHYEKSLKYYLKFLSEDDSELLPIYINIGILLHQQNNLIAGMKILKRALNIALRTPKIDHLQISTIYHHIAEIYDEQGIFVDAIQNYQSALENELRHFPLQHLLIANTYIKIGEIFYRMEDFTTSFSYFDKALNIQKKFLLPNHSLLGVTNYNIALVLDGLDQHKEAIEYASRALNIARHSHGPKHDDVHLYEEYLRELRRKTLIGVIPNGAVYE